MSIHHNQDVTQVIYIVLNPAFWLIFISMFGFSALFSLDHLTAESMCLIPGGSLTLDEGLAAFICGESETTEQSQVAPYVLAS